MKALRSTILSIVIAPGILMAVTAWGAQNQPKTIDRAQMRRSIEVIEGILNTVRQQVLTSVASTLAKEGGPHGLLTLSLHSSEGNLA